MAAADQEPHVSAVRPRSYQDESYLHGFLGTVGDLQKNGAFQDVVLEVEGRRFPCHRLVLSAASPYFRAMFTSDMAESRQKTVVLQGLDAGMFEEILSYIYSGTLHVSLDKVQPLYQAADLLQLDYVRDTCCSYMAMNVERSTCVDLYKFADVFSLDIVQKACMQLIHRNFAEVASSEEFCSLSVNQLTEIISHDELDIKEETTVWEAVVRWVQHSREDRRHHLPNILPHIRFNLLTSDDTAAILEHSLVKEDPGISGVIRNVVQKGNPNLKPRLGMTTEMVLLFNDDSKEILFMNPQEGPYIRCTYKPEDFPRATDVAVSRDNNIYILTNKRDSNDQLSIFKYNHAENVWEDAGMSSVSKRRRQEKDISHNDLLVEVDGILYYLDVDLEYGEILMQKYNGHTDQWEECSLLCLDNSAYDSAAVSCGPHIYFLTSKELHRYDSSQDCWSKRALPVDIPEVCTAVAMGTGIFCADVYFTQTIVYNTESDCWQKLQGWPENCNTFHVSRLFVVDNQLHILLTCAGVYLVFVYDRSADAWSELEASLPNKRYYRCGSGFPVARIYLPYLNGTSCDSIFQCCLQDNDT
ncbi:kelch repeat and BTB domain-containing protein 2-like [Branchiostoma floridae x Branchiostoma japonicum]